MNLAKWSLPLGATWSTPTPSRPMIWHFEVVARSLCPPWPSHRTFQLKLQKKVDSVLVSTANEGKGNSFIFQISFYLLCSPASSRQSLGAKIPLNGVAHDVTYERFGFGWWIWRSALTYYRSSMEMKLARLKVSILDSYYGYLRFWRIIFYLNPGTPCKMFLNSRLN